MEIGSPVDYFNIGRAGGAAKSPAVGMAIRSITEQAEKIMGYQQQAFAQGAAALPGAMAKAGLENAPKPVYVYDHLTGELVDAGQVPGRADVSVPSFGEGSMKASIMRDEWRKEQAAGGGGGGPAAIAPSVTAPPASTSEYFTQPSGTFQGSPGTPAAPATPAPTQPGQAGPTPLQPQGISPDVYQTPEFQQLLEEIIRKKSTGGL